MNSGLFWCFLYLFLNVNLLVVITWLEQMGLTWWNHLVSFDPQVKNTHSLLQICPILLQSTQLGLKLINGFSFASLGRFCRILFLLLVRHHQRWNIGIYWLWTDISLALILEWLICVEVIFEVVRRIPCGLVWLHTTITIPRVNHPIVLHIDQRSPCGQTILSTLPQILLWFQVAIFVGFASSRSFGLFGWGRRRWRVGGGTWRVRGVSSRLILLKSSHQIWIPIQRQLIWVLQAKVITSVHLRRMVITSHQLTHF